MINKTVYIILLNLGQHHKDLVITVYTYLHPIYSSLRRSNERATVYCHISIITIIMQELVLN